MDGLGAYLLSVICAATICGIVTNFFELKGALGAAVKLAAGAFLAFTVIGPIAGCDMGNLTDWDGLYDADAANAVEQGKAMTHQALSDGIKARCEAYILDKAGDMELSITVEVGVSDDEIPVPSTVRISGDISPYKKTRLKAILANDLGIAEENQIWI